MNALIDAEKRVTEIETMYKDALKLSFAAVLSSIEVAIMASLYTEDGQSASGLAKSVGRAATSFTPILDRLQGYGFVERKMHPADRRGVNVWLTKRGEGIRDDVCGAVEAVELKVAKAAGKRGG